MNTIRSHGSIPFFNWGSESSPISKDAAELPAQGHHRRTYDTYITNFATAAKNWGHPFFLRFDSEMNGSWSPWGVLTNGNSGERLRPRLAPRARHLHQRRRDQRHLGLVPQHRVRHRHHRLLQAAQQPLPRRRLRRLDLPRRLQLGHRTPASRTSGRASPDVSARHYNTITGTIAPSKPMIIARDRLDRVRRLQGGLDHRHAQHADPDLLPEDQGLPLVREAATACDWPIETSSTSQSAFVTGIKSSIYAANSFAASAADPSVPPDSSHPSRSSQIPFEVLPDGDRVRV